MPTHYTEEQITEIANDILKKYPEDLLFQKYREYSWEEMTNQNNESWNDRETRSKNLLQSLETTNFENEVQSIHEWGFDQPFSIQPEATQANFLITLRNALCQLRDANNPVNIENTLVTAIDYRGVGIATISKWFCFIDQERYSIFDSRVSIALREVNITIEGDECRAFPIVGRRQGARPYAWLQTSLSKARWIRSYIDYIRAIRRVSTLIKNDSLHLKVGQIEMALFMIGDVWPQTKEESQLPPIFRAMWSRD